MTLVDKLTVAGLFLGPLAAVLISLVAESRRQEHQRKTNVLRTLLVGRLNIADPSFQIAINTIPIDFAHDDRVLSAWEEYVAATAIPAGDQPATHAAQTRWNDALTELVRAVLLANGYSKRAAGQITRSVYISTASADQRCASARVIRVTSWSRSSAIAAVSSGDSTSL